MKRALQPACVLLCLSVTVASAQRRSHPPTAGESAMLTHYQDVILDVLGTFANDTWRESLGSDLTEIVVSDDPDVPLDVSSFIGVFYTNDREIARVAAQLERLTDPATMAVVAEQLTTTKLSLEVHFNRAAVTIDPAPAGNPDLHLPGVALAYRVNNSRFEKGASVVLLFGDWKSAALRDGTYHFKFTHRAGQPAIENIEFHFDGSMERIEELLHTVKWQHVNDALVRASP